MGLKYLARNRDSEVFFFFRGTTRPRFLSAAVVLRYTRHYCRKNYHMFQSFVTQLKISTGHKLLRAEKKSASPCTTPWDESFVHLPG